MSRPRALLHHVEICVEEERSILVLLHRFGFRITHFRSNDLGCQWVLTSDKSTFVVTKRQRNDGCCNEDSDYKVNTHRNDNNCLDNVNPGLGEGYLTQPEPHNITNVFSASYPVLFCCGCAPIGHSVGHLVDAVFNIALEVVNLDVITNKIISVGGTVVLKPVSIIDDHGEVRLAVVQSVCENVVHTLLDKSNYNGQFLPGFQSFKPCNYNDFLFSCATGAISICEYKFDEEESELTNYIDHVTYVCRAGESQSIVQWYEECFHMRRFMTNNQETVEDGFVLGNEIGLRLKVLQFWRCAETGVASTADPKHPDVLRIVVAEPLPGAEKSHVSAFLRSNYGPGVQHIALHCQRIVDVVTKIGQRGTLFRMPPPTYYDEVLKLREFVEGSLGIDFTEFRKSGILVDEEDSEKDEQGRYLMQVFTHPVFSMDTFFFEVIQRCGAVGFGAGNITALARSIIRYQEEIARQEAQTENKISLKNCSEDARDVK